MKKVKFIEIVPGEVSTKDLHGFLLGATAPRPIAFASTIGSDGVPNLAPFSFFNVFSSNPPTLIFSPARRVRDNTTKHTLDNIIRTPEVVINVVPHELVHQMNLASAEYPDGISEYAKAGLTELPSDLVAPPRLGESPVQMECKVFEIKPLSNQGGGGNLIFCRVVKMHINTAILDEKGRIDIHKINLVGRCGGIHYSRTNGDAAFVVEKPLSPAGIGVDALPESVRLSHVLTGNDLARLGNSALLPSKEEVLLWWKKNKTSFAGMNLNGWHLEGQKLLHNGNKFESACVLIAADFYKS